MAMMMLRKRFAVCRKKLPYLAFRRTARMRSGYLSLILQPNTRDLHYLCCCRDATFGFGRVDFSNELWKEEGRDRASQGHTLGWYGLAGVEK